jgi:hypothetical protein
MEIFSDKKQSNSKVVSDLEARVFRSVTEWMDGKKRSNNNVSLPPIYIHTRKQVKMYHASFNMSKN